MRLEQLKKRLGRIEEDVPPERIVLTEEQRARIRAILKKRDEWLRRKAEEDQNKEG